MYHMSCCSAPQVHEACYHVPMLGVLCCVCVRISVTQTFFSQCITSNSQSGICEKTPAWLTVPYVSDAPPAPRAQCWLVMQRVCFTKTGVFFRSRHMPPGRASTLNIRGAGVSACRCRSLWDGRFFSQIPESNIDIHYFIYCVCMCVGSWFECVLRRLLAIDLCGASSW